MKLLPQSSMVLLSPLAPSEVLSLVKDNTDTAATWLRKSKQRLQGSVSGSTFSVACSTNELHKNAYRPQFSGSPKPIDSGSQMSLTLTLMPSLAGLASLWFAGCGAFVVIGLLILLLTRSFATATFLGIPVLILAIGYALVHTQFRQGAADSKPILLDILKAKEIKANK